MRVRHFILSLDLAAVTSVNNRAAARKQVMAQTHKIRSMIQIERGKIPVEPSTKI
jgi:hypothetical protein